MNGAETVFAHQQKNCYDGYSASALVALEERSLANFERYNELWKQPFVWCTDPEDIIRAMRRGFMKAGMRVPWEMAEKPTAKCMG